MIEQTDKRLNAKIQRYGCYLLCLGAIAESKWNHTFGVNEINQIYEKCRDMAYIDDDCYVMSPDGVLLEYRNAIFEIPALQGRILQVGIKDGMGNRFWNWVKGIKIDYTICCFRTEFGNKHFVLLQSDGAIDFDPLPSCRVTGQAYLVFYRWFEK